MPSVWKGRYLKQFDTRLRLVNNVPAFGGLGTSCFDQHRCLWGPYAFPCCSTDLNVTCIPFHSETGNIFYGIHLKIRGKKVGTFTELLSLGVILRVFYLEQHQYTHIFPRRWENWDLFTLLVLSSHNDRKQKLAAMWGEAEQAASSRKQLVLWGEHLKHTNAVRCGV